MKFQLGAVLIGAVLFMVSSCATVPSQPLTSGELRLSKIGVLRDAPVSEDILYTAEIVFEANGEPKIQRACCSEPGGDGPRCFSDIMDLDFGPRGSFDVRLPGLGRGNHRMECYVEYTSGGERKKTNVVGTNISVGR